MFTPLLRLEDRLGGESNRGNHPGIYVIGRLKPEVTVERARSEVVEVAKRLAEEHPQSSARQSMTLVPLLDAPGRTRSASTGSSWCSRRGWPS